MYTWPRPAKLFGFGVGSQTSSVPIQLLTFCFWLRCCPGGFTSYILDKNAKATGLGISLDIEKGGHTYLLEEYHRHRFDLLFSDLTYYQLGPSRIINKKFRSLPLDIRLQMFDVAVLDGHFLRTHASSTPWDLHRLLISQLIMGLQAVKKGGTIVIKLSRPERVDTAKILRMLDMISLELSTCKPRSMHANRGTFYAIAKGVGHGIEAKRLPDVLDSFKRLWVELTFGGEESKGRFMNDTDLDFVIGTDDLAEEYSYRLVELVRDVWSVQAASLGSWYKRKGI